MSAIALKNRKTRPNGYVARKTAPEKSPSSTTLRMRQDVMNNVPVRKILSWFSGIILMVLLLCATGAGILKVFQICMSSSYFNLQTINVEGNFQFSKEDIYNLSGLQTGQNSLTIRITDVEKRLLANPWIEAVTIKRSLPDSFNIKIVEKKPQFWVLKDNALHYLDQEGCFIAPVESKNFVSLPTLDIGAGGEEFVIYLNDFMQKLHSTELPFDVSQISWLRISAGKGFELYWENKNLSLCIGVEDWQQNLTRLGLVIEDLEKRQEISVVKEIISADGQVWIEKV